MIYLLPEQLLFLHYRLVNRAGGEHGVRDLGQLLNALERPRAVVDGQELYPNLWWKTAALVDSLLRNGPSTTNNQPLAIAAAGLFLQLNRYRLIMEPEQMVEFVRTCARRQATLAEMAVWFERHAYPM